MKPMLTCLTLFFGMLAGAVLLGFVGVLLAVRTGSDAAAKAPAFEKFVDDSAMQIAAMSPQFLNVSEMPADARGKQAANFDAQLIEEGKPEAMIENIAKGKLGRFFKDNTLVNQDYIKDGAVSVSGYVKSVNPSLTVTGFKRVALG